MITDYTPADVADDFAHLAERITPWMEIIELTRENVESTARDWLANGDYDALERYGIFWETDKSVGFNTVGDIPDEILGVWIVGQEQIRRSESLSTNPILLQSIRNYGNICYA